MTGATSSLLARPCTQRLFLISITENEAAGAKISDGGNSSAVAGRPEHATKKMTSKNTSKTGSAAEIVVKPQKGTSLKVTPDLNV